MTKLEQYIADNEDMLLDKWDVYKFENYCGELFHHDDTDFFHEGLFMDMCEKFYEEEEKYLREG